MKPDVREPAVRVMVTIDTEEDDWGTYQPHGASVECIGRLPELGPLWEKYGVRPTYFVNYPPLASPESIPVLTELASEGTGEFGVHCHPWNSPPVGELGGAPVTMMNQLSEEENDAKLTYLTTLFQEIFQTRPRAFRAGRWGFGPSVARPLVRLGYETDSSVSPFTDWSPEGGPDYTRAPRHAYRFDPANPLVPSLTGSLLEIPTSVGFLSRLQTSSGWLRLGLERSAVSSLRVVGLLDSLGLLTKRWLSPEVTSANQMIRLARALVRSGNVVLDCTFHSSSLLAGSNPFVQSESDRLRLFSRLEEFLDFCVGQEFTFSTVSEVAEAIQTGSND